MAQNVFKNNKLNTYSKCKCFSSVFSEMYVGKKQNVIKYYILDPEYKKIDLK